MIDKNIKLVEDLIKEVKGMKLFSKRSVLNIDIIEINDYEKQNILLMKSQTMK